MKGFFANLTWHDGSLGVGVSSAENKPGGNERCSPMRWDKKRKSLKKPEGEESPEDTSQAGKKSEKPEIQWHQKRLFSKKYI